MDRPQKTPMARPDSATPGGRFGPRQGQPPNPARNNANPRNYHPGGPGQVPDKTKLYRGRPTSGIPGKKQAGPGIGGTVVTKKAPEGTATKPLEFQLKDLLRLMVKHGASDLHVKTGSPPVVRLNGELFPVGKQDLTPGNCRELIFGICTRTQQEKLMQGQEVDFAFADGGTRFRINAFLQKSTYSASIRMIKDNIPNFQELFLPEKLKELSNTRQGLILVTGPAGSGKSTTLASMIDYINMHRALHIVTVEDPIEYVHSHKNCIITQREVGSDTNSFKDALKYALRQDPNVILIGEMRDPESIMIAAQAAETGHLVMSTLHTPNAIQSISRILDVFSGENKKQIQVLLASNLRAVISQRLIVRDDTEGRVPAVEVMVVTPTIASLILEGSINDIYKYISEGSNYGMQTLNQSLFTLHGKGLITREKALENSDYVTELRMMFQGYTMDTTGMVDNDSPDNLMSWL